MDRHTTIESLPNELLTSILSQLPTRSLLPLAAVSHRFYSLTLRILKQRLKRVTSLPDHRLILECYHPAEKLSTPYLYCDYVYTDNFEEIEAEAEATAGSGEPTLSREATPIGGLRGVYSHFRPVSQEENRRGRLRYPRQNGGGQGLASSSQPQPEEPIPSLDVYLDEDEPFSQLCTVTNLVRLGPRPGLFLSHVNVSDGLIRLPRAWLADQSAAANGLTGDGGGEAVLWADPACDVGLRFRVRERDIRSEHPVLVASNEELPVAYRLEFGELVVRTSTLLMMVEKSETREVAAEGKAIVIASI
ncbi:hypothetical protein VTK56DRAFT_5049 [Thermocarpiscus australiensis]